MANNQVNVYETRTMLPVLEQRKTSRTFMRNTFFGPAGTGRAFPTRAVDIDIIKGRRRMAPFVSPKHAGKLIEDRGREMRTYKPSYLKPKLALTPTDMYTRQPGNVIYQGNMTPAQMAGQAMGRRLAELDDMLNRREEWMSVQAIVNGKVEVKGEGIDEVIDMHYDASQLPVLSGTALWTDHTNAKPLDNLKTWQRERAKASGISPSIGIFGRDAIDNFMKTAQIRGADAADSNWMDTRKIDMGQIRPEMLPNGVMYYGFLRETNMEIYSYDEWYIDDIDQKEYPMMPTDKVILGNPQARTEFLYGAVEDLDVTAQMARFPKSWDKKDPSVKYLMIQSAPLPVLTEVDAFACATVV